MTKGHSLTDKAPKLFEVTYCVEQGYAIRIEANSPEDAERIIEERLDEKANVLDGSTRVHHAHFVNTVEELAIRCSDACTNGDRARWAGHALKSFSRETGSEMGQEALYDLLCDLGHYADQHGLDFKDQMRRAAETWADEKAEEQQGAHP